MYPRCELHIESTLHLFFTCPRVRQRWCELKSLMRDSSMEGAIQDSLFASITSLIWCSKWRLAPSVLISEVYCTNWTEHNAASFGHTYSRLPNSTMLQRVETKLKAMNGQTTSMKKLRQIEKMIQDCTNILMPWRRNPMQSTLEQVLPNDQLSNKQKGDVENKDQDQKVKDQEQERGEQMTALQTSQEWDSQDQS